MKPVPVPNNGKGDATRIAWLVSGYIRHTLTEAELDELDDWITASDNNQALFEELTNPHTIKQGLDFFDTTQPDAALQKIKQRIRFAQEPKRRNRYIGLAIAASVLVLVGLFVLYRFMNTSTPGVDPIVHQDSLQPGGNHATLTLANGKVIQLDAVKNGLLDSSSGSDVLKTSEGQLSYENPEGTMVAFHRLNTPVGGMYSVLLPDGTRVWLNSSSSLTYPVAFTGKERRVKLTGEAYFEVSHYMSKGQTTNAPFIVSVNDRIAVEVMGTKFNVNAYNDEPFIATSLIEGKVKVGSEDSGGDWMVIGPGQQVRADAEGALSQIVVADINSTAAWKDGKFKFNDATIDEVMRQVQRWYGATVIYDAKPTAHFNATIYRHEPVEKLLSLLEATGRVTFVIEGKTVRVKGG